VYRNYICITIGGIKIRSRVIEEKYPDYKEVFSVSALNCAKVSVDDLMRTLRKVARYTNVNDNHRVKILDEKN